MSAAFTDALEALVADMQRHMPELQAAVRGMPPFSPTRGAAAELVLQITAFGLNLADTAVDLRERVASA